MIDAFHAHSLLELGPKEKPRIESLLAYADRLLLGLNNGSVRLYQVQSSDSGDLMLDHLKTVEKFSRRAVEQLACIKEASILVALSDGYISIHDLDTCTLQQQLVKTKGASTFAVTTNIERDESTGIPSIVSRLAVAVKRRVLLYSWQDEEFLDGKEISLTGNIRTLTWLNGKKLVAGLASGFIMVDISTGTPTEIVPPPNTSGTDQQGEKGWGAYGMSYVGMGGWGSKSLSAKLKGDELVLVKDGNTMYVDDSGRASMERRPIQWPSQPDALGYSYPYLVSLHSSKQQLEIRNPETQSLIQTISLTNPTVLHVPAPNVSLVHAGKLFYVASPTQVWKMGSADYETQVNQLVDRGYLDEAISLLEQLESVLMESKEDRLREVQILKGEALFKDKQYREAMELFANISAPPDRVVRMFPPSIAGELATVDDAVVETTITEEDDPPQVSEAHQDVSNCGVDAGPTDNLNSGEKSHSDDGNKTEEVLSQEQQQNGDIVENDNQDASTGIEGDSIPTAVAPERNVLDGNDLKRATNELTVFLGNTRLNVSKAIENCEKALKRVSAISSSDGEQVVAPDTPVTMSQKNIFEGGFTLANSSTDSLELQMERLLEIARLVDTTLFRAYILVKPGLVGPLVRRPNHCDPAVVGEKLKEGGKFNDLVDFFGGKKLHREALSLLKQFGEAEEEDERAPSLYGPDRTITYLQSLDASQIDLILEFSVWVLKADPQAGMEIFLADTEKAESLPRARIIDFLQGLDRTLAIQYLEHLIENLDDMSPDFHSRLAGLYLAHISNNNWEGKEEEKEFWKEKLLAFLKDSSQYRTEKVLAWLPADNPDFYESRAVVLSNMGRHKAALEIYVFKIRDHEKAEAYCNHVFRAAPIEPETPGKKITDSVYHILLSLYLRPPASNPTQIQPALDLLSRHGARLDASEALSLIPEETKVRELEAYFQRRIRAANTKVSESMIASQLWRAESLKVEEKLSRKRGLSAVVGETRVCPICHKRLGRSVISVMPNGSAVHYGCGHGKTLKTLSER